MNYLMEHTYIGMDLLDILFCLLFLAVTVFCVAEIRQKKRERSQLEERLEDYKNQTVNIE